MFVHVDSANGTITHKGWLGGFLRKVGGLPLVVFLTLGTVGGVEARDSESVGGPLPHIVVIVADDLGWGDLGCYGCPDIRTPCLDRLAAEGIRFTQLYANGPECTPTRTAFFTARYQQRVGGLECAIGVGNVGRYDDAERLAQQRQLGLPPEEATVTQVLAAAGYRLVAVGKWHLGYEYHFLPRRFGFEYYFGCLGGAVDYFHHVEPDGTPMLYENDDRVRREGYMTDLITGKAVDVIKNHMDPRPLFLYVAYTAPHSPYQAPGQKPPWPVPPEEQNKGTREVYKAMVERMDLGIGQILDALAERDMVRNTLVIFFSDNGGTGPGRNAPFRGGKGGLFEGGIRVPGIVRWPGVLPSGRVYRYPVMTFDLSCSILRAVKAPLPAGHWCDGIDIFSYVAAEEPPPDRPLFWRARRGNRTWKAVRLGDWKYILRIDGQKKEEFLFNLANDPTEEQNLWAEEPERVNMLRSLLEAWERDVRSKR